jgi:hypothetical protein
MAGTGDKDRYSSDGTDLLEPPVLNLNPYDIEKILLYPKEFTQEKWNKFYYFVNNNFDKKDTSINSSIKKSKTDNLIKRFNEEVWYPYSDKNPSIYRGKTNPLTREDIFAIQRFTKKTYPKTLVDGWLGTQTLQMKYPPYIIEQNVNSEDENKFMPAIWGEYRFIIKYKNYIDIKNGVDNNPQLKYFIPYNPDIYTADKLTYPIEMLKWFIEAKNYEPNSVKVNKTPSQVNVETLKKQVNSNIKQLQTKIKGSF